MLLDAGLVPDRLSQVPELARQAEAFGFDGVWTSETQHDPFLPLVLAAEHSQRLTLGTAVAISLARSPMTVAYTAWDLAGASAGRFILGLGTQVRAHIRRRFGMPWPESPPAQQREFVEALRAIWRSWSDGEPLDFRGQYYKLTLMTPFFRPPPIDSPAVPVYLAAVNPGLARLAGEVADGLHAHPLHTADYLRQVVRPAIAAGAETAGRDPAQVALSVTAFVVEDENEADEVRRQIAFYASTPAYRRVLALHGWESVGERLSQLARRGQWAAMGAEVPDDMLEQVAVVAPAEELGAALRRRYQGLADRLTIYRPFRAGERDEDWRRLLAGWQS
jgi:probable F420-dependent oxidoreductase